MKLLMENWREYLNEEELEEGRVGQAVAALGVMAVGFFGPPAYAAETDVVITSPSQVIDADSVQMSGAERMKLEAAIQSAFFPELKADSFKMYDRENIDLLAKKAGTTLEAAVESTEGTGELATVLDANVVNLTFDRTNTGMTLYATVYDTNGDIVSKERAELTNDAASWGQLASLADKSVKALTDSIRDDVKEFKVAMHTHNPGG